MTHLLRVARRNQRRIVTAKQDMPNPMMGDSLVGTSERRKTGERTGLVRKVTNVALSEIAGDAGAPFAAVTSGLSTRELIGLK